MSCLAFRPGTGGLEPCKQNAQQSIQLHLLVVGERAHVAFIQLGQRLVQGFAKFAAVIGDADPHHPPVLFTAAPSHQAVLLHAVDEAGDVGHTVDQALADGAARFAFGVALDQNSQHIELGFGQAEALEEAAEVVGNCFMDLYQGQMGVASDGGWELGCQGVENCS